MKVDWQTILLAPGMAGTSAVHNGHIYEIPRDHSAAGPCGADGRRARCTRIWQTLSEFKRGSALSPLNG